MKENQIKLVICCLLLFSFSLFSCKKDGKNCIRVQYISGYCYYPGAGLVEVLERNDDATASTNNGYTTYTMALLNLPEEFRVRDKVFFVKYYQDESLPEAEPRACPLDIAPANLFVAKSASQTGCD